MKKILILLLFITGCSPVIIPTNPTEMNSDFIYAADDCSVWMLATDGSDNPCGPWHDKVNDAIERWEQCWNDVPEPADQYLKQCDSDVKRAIKAKQRMMVELDRYCNGNGDFDSVMEQLRITTEALESANEWLNQY